MSGGTWEAWFKVRVLVQLVSGEESSWLPGFHNLLAAFSPPVHREKYREQQQGLWCLSLFLLVSPLIRTAILLNRCPMLMTLSSLNYFLWGPVSKYSHTGDDGFNIRILWGHTFWHVIFSLLFTSKYMLLLFVISSLIHHLCYCLISKHWFSSYPSVTAFLLHSSMVRNRSLYFNFWHLLRPFLLTSLW